MRYALFAFYLCSIFILLVGLLYYPRFEQPQAEATIGYDVSGYYLYLPAFFIYKDVKKLGFRESINQRYQTMGGISSGMEHKTTKVCA